MLRGIFGLRSIYLFNKWLFLECDSGNNAVSCAKRMRGLAVNRSEPRTSILVHYFSTEKATSKTPESVKKQPKKQENSSPFITLVGTDNNPQVLRFSDAEKLAKRRNLKLVNVVGLDTKSQRPIYRLMTASQYLNEGVDKEEKSSSKKSGSIKGEKLLTISYRISEHDLASRLKHISKWLAKTYEIRIVINGDANNMTTAEQVYDKIAEGVGTEGRILQKRLKGSDIRFQILPPKKKTVPEDNTNT